MTNGRGFIFIRHPKPDDRLVFIAGVRFNTEGEELLKLLLSNYGHCVPNKGIYTPDEFSAKIREAYSDENPQNKAVLDFLSNLQAISDAKEVSSEQIP